MQQTNQYKLNLIESGDSFSPQPINENSEKLEEALNAQTQAIEAAKAAGLQICTGTYTGTGTYGSTNKNTLTFPFRPCVVFIGQSDSAYYGGVWLQGSTAGRSFISESIANVTLSWSGNSVTWYYYNNALTQLNEKGKTYCYIAIGLNKAD